MAVNFMDMGKMAPREYTAQSLSVPPDVGIFCSKCREFIQVLRIRDHRAAHKALSIFGYKKVSQVKSLDQLAIKRVELQQAIANEHRDSISSKDKETAGLPVLRAPGRPRPPNSLDTLVAAKREYLLIDEAYQIIRDYCFFDKSPFILKPKSEVRHCVGLPSLSTGILAVGIAADQNDAYRPAMEDFRLLVDPFGPPAAGACLFGIFDGYNGTRAANFACKSVPQLLLEELARIDPSFTEECMLANEDCWGKEMATKAEILRLARNMTCDLMSSALQKAQSACEQQAESVDNNNSNACQNNALSPEEMKIINVRRALAKSIVQADKNLATVGDELSLVRWSGCSATIGMVVPQKCVNQDDIKANNDDTLLFMSNCGNAHALVIEGGRPRMLTEDHSVENANEVRKVVERGGKVTGTGTKKLVCGLLATTRGMGNYGQPELRKAVLCSPCTNFRKLASDAQMIVIGTPGLWSVLSKNEVATIAMQTITYCCSKTANSGKQQRLETASTLLQMDSTFLSVGGDNIQQYNNQVAEAKLPVVEVTQSEATDSYAERAGKQPDEFDLGDKRPSDESENKQQTEIEQHEKSPGERTDDQESEVSATEIPASAKPSEEKPPWWQRNLTEDLPTESADPFPGSVVAAEKAAKAKNPEPILETRQEEEKPQEQPPSTVSSSFNQLHAEAARTVALNLASAALLAGSQDNVTVQVLLLPNYRTLSEVHSRPLIAPLPNVPTALQF